MRIGVPFDLPKPVLWFLLALALSGNGYQVGEILGLRPVADKSGRLSEAVTIYAEAYERAKRDCQPSHSTPGGASGSL